MSTHQALRVAFMAPVPAGHEVLIATLRMSEESDVRASLVLDVSARALYCDERLWDPLLGDPRATIDPLAVLAQYSWVLETRTVGRVLGTATASRDRANMASARTVLYFEPMAAVPAYR
jgi:hypothetical protein